MWNVKSVLGGICFIVSIFQFDEDGRTWFINLSLIFRIKRRYSKRTAQWVGMKIKAPKRYEYVPTLQERIVEARLSDEEPITRRVGLMEDDPRAICPSTAPVPAPITEEIKKRMADFTRMWTNVLKLCKVSRHDDHELDYKQDLLDYLHFSFRQSCSSIHQIHNSVLIMYH